jgi:hypothetical protein
MTDRHADGAVEHQLAVMLVQATLEARAEQRRERLAAADAVQQGEREPHTALGCQRPSVSPQWRPSDLPTGGHVFSPLVAIGSPQRAVVAEPSP